MQLSHLPPDSELDEDFKTVVRLRLKKFPSRKVGMYLGIHEDIILKISGMYPHEKQSRKSLNGNYYECAA